MSENLTRAAGTASPETANGAASELEKMDTPKNGEGGSRKFVGAKGGAGVWQQIISQMPPHRIYIEPFLGTGIVMKRKWPSTTSIGVEIDAAVAGAFPKGCIPGCHIFCEDAMLWLERKRISFGIDHLIYCDPPYLLSTRKHRTYYEHEFSDLQHIELLKILQKLPCKVILSGYWSELYASRLKSWRTINFTTTTRGGERVTEWLWMNFPEPFELHDTRYLGANFRERERIKRKRLRWVNRLKSMSRLDRAAILAAIAEVRSSNV